MSNVRKPARPSDRRKPASEVFEFEGADGKIYTLPRFGSWPAGLTRRLRKLGEPDATFTLLEEVASEEALRALDEVSQDRFNEIIAAWSGEEGASLGE